jgi:integrase
MAKRNSDNRRIKRKYLVWLKDARGLSDASIDKAAASISRYEDWLADKDFRTLHSERARAFKRHLAGLRNNRTGTPLSPATLNATLRDVKTFFYWLADQPCYRSRINRSDADYLSPDRKSDEARRGSLWKPHPSPEQARHVVLNMAEDTVLQRRDRALMALLFLTCSRETAAISLQIRHVDTTNRCVQFDGRDVDTKFGKSFTTAFYPMGETVEQVLFDWIDELKRDHLFSTCDPLFPKTRVGLGPDRRFAALGILREPWASASSAAKIFKQAFADAGLPPFSPHRVRDMIATLGSAHCRTPEEFKAWSQNMGHDDVLTTFRSYGSVAPGRQMELMRRFRKRGPRDDGFDVIE